MGRLFGTDGVRGVANSELGLELVSQLGLAGAHVLAGHLNRQPRILVARDTRVSGYMLEAALVTGLAAAGADVYTAGILTTPAVAYLVANHGFDAGVMISASHNPFEYNGIKFFNEHGFKLADSVEDEIEAAIQRGDSPRPTGTGLGRHFAYEEGKRLYTTYLKQKSDLDLKGMHIALDCANGSAADSAPGLFRDLGAKLELLGVEPDGLNINANSGSTHMDNLKSLVVDKGCDIGLAFDGDADRLLAVDGRGQEVDGDQIMAVIAGYLKRSGRLNHDTIVATVMSNMGFDKYCGRHGYKLVRTSVGDRYVLEEMQKQDYSIGGEQSGHVILRDYATTGDGMLTALILLKALQTAGTTLEEAVSDFVIFPQVLRQVRVDNARKKAILDDSEVRALSDEVSKRLEGRGRLLLRASGTEPVIRVMLEGESQDEIEGYAEDLVRLIERK